MSDTLTARDTQFTYADTAAPRKLPAVEREVNAAQYQLEQAWKAFYATVDGREFLDCDTYWEERAARIAWIDICKLALELAEMRREKYYLDCTCTPIPTACQACRDANKARWGDEIPVEGIYFEWTCPRCGARLPSTQEYCPCALEGE